MPRAFFFLAPLLCAAAVGLAFGPALSAHFVDWDDQDTVVENRALRAPLPELVPWAFTTLQQGHYQPLSWLSLRLDLAGAQSERDAARRMHATNLVLHALSAWLFCLCALHMLRRATPERGRALDALALFAGLCWALHPLRVESVAWITERRDVLSGAFFLFALCAWLVRAEGVAPRALYATSLVALLLSLGAKAWGVVFPALLLVLDAWPLQRWRERSWRALVLEKLPFFAVALPFAIVAGRAQAALPAAMPGLAEHTLLERVLQAGYGLVFYPWKSLFPTGLIPLYPIPEDGLALAAPRFLVPLVLAVAALGALLVLWRRLPGMAAAGAAYAIVIAPVLGFAQAGPQLVADRYSYLATLPFALLAAAALGRLARAGAAGRAAALALGLACLAALGAASRRQTRVWHDTESLWTHTLAIDPDHAIAHLGLGNERMRAAFTAAADAALPRERVVELLRDAERHFLRGFDSLADPRFPTKLALLYAALADFEPEQRTEHLARAKEFSSRAVELAVATGRMRPETRRAHATNLLAAGDPAGAAALLAGYVREVPDDPLGWRTLGQALLATGDAAGAASALEQATRLAPEDPYAWLDLARARSAQGQRDLARAAAELALQLDPSLAAARELLEALR